MNGLNKMLMEVEGEVEKMRKNPLLLLLLLIKKYTYIYFKLKAYV